MTLTLLVTGWAVVAAAFTAVALWRLRRTPKPAPSSLPPVLLLRPVDAPTPHELENLGAPIDYPGELEQVVLAPFRPRLASHVEWLWSDPPTANRKVGHLLYGLSVFPADGRVVLAVDADVRVDGALVASLATAVADGAALAWAAPAPRGGRTGAAAAVRGLLNHTHQSFLALDAVRTGAAPVCGKALALGPAAQRELPRLSDCVGEDLELSTRLHGEGARVEQTATLAVVPQPRVDAATAWDRFTRWMQVLRAHRPGLFPTIPLLFSPTPLLVVLAAWAGGPALPAVAALVALRSALAARLGARSGARAGDWWTWALGEVLLLASFLRALTTRTVTWRGRAFELGAGGRLRPLAHLGPPPASPT